MKFTRLFLSGFFAVFYLFFTINKSYSAVQDGFFFAPFATIEYSTPSFSGSYGSKNLRSDDAFNQLRNLDNIALGFHGRIHKYVGINANWSQADLSTHILEGYNLAQTAKFGVENRNFSALFFAPLIGDSLLEVFGELGVSSIHSKLRAVETNGNNIAKSASENKMFFGAGIQFAPFSFSQDAFRISFQRYVGKLDLIDANYTTVRIGYIKAF